MTTFAEADPPRRPRFTVDPVALDAPDIVRNLSALRPALRSEFATIGPDEYARAFMVAGLVKQDMIRTVHDALVEAYQDKTGEQAFVDRLTPILREQGFLGGDDDAIGRRLDLVFDTNLTIAQSAGNWARIQRSKRLLPYIRYQATLDGRVRHTHAAMHGVIRPVDDPLWDRWFAPAGFRCRCVCSAITEGQMRRLGGVTEALPNVEPDPGWGYNTGKMAMLGALRAADTGNGDRIDGTPPVDTGAAIVRGSRRWLAVNAVVGALRGLFPSQ